MCALGEGKVEGEGAAAGEGVGAGRPLRPCQLTLPWMTNHGVLTSAGSLYTRRKPFSHCATALSPPSSVVGPS